MSNVRAAHAVPILYAVALVLGSTAPATADGDGLTLENIFKNETFKITAPTELTWLPDGRSFLYRQQRDDVDGLWRESVTSGGTVLVVDWDDLTRRLGGLRPGYTKPAMDDVNRHPRVGRRPVISPDGRSYVRLQRDDLALLDLESGDARYLTEGPAPELYATYSGDGTKLAFARDGDLYWLELATGREHRLTDRGDHGELFNGVSDWVYEEELGIKKSFWWSPDGRRIAYIQYDTSPVTTFPITDELELIAHLEEQKYPKAGGANAEVRLGVVDLGTGATSWIPTGVGDGYIARVGWLPVGGELWFQILNRAQNRLELRFASVDGGASRLVLAEQDDAWVNVRDDLTFVDRQRFVWSSERDGWRHLYLYGIDGRVIRRLTEGPWQVDEVYGLDAARTRVVVQANAEDYRERHLYSVGLDGSGARLLATQGGTHSAELAPDGAHLLDTWSNVTTPDRVELYDVSGRRVRTVHDGRIPALDAVSLVAPEFSSLTTDDGETLYTWMLRPPDFDASKRYPVLVYVYGGPNSQQVVNRWGRERFLYYQNLARRGLIVFSLDNRGSWGRGHAFEAAIRGRMGERELADQVAGVRYLKTLPYVDPERIGVYGGSYGGYMVLTAMNKAPEHFKVGVAYAPVAAWELYDTIYTERYMGLPSDNPDGYRNSAPLNFAAGLEGRLLICHGTMDNNVHLQNTLMMAEEYVKAGKLFDMMVYPRVRHGIRVSHHRYHFHRLKTEFLLRHLIQDGAR
jgi:dipeptidyl-peptidase-4